jgi:stage II sporulation SpoAA-like protein
VVELLPDLPAGTIGFRVSGTVTRDEYHQMLDPVLAALERGETINLLTVADDDFHGLDLEALWEDMKAAPSVGLKHRKSSRRLAVVTNKDWMRRAIGGFGWLYPGETRVFDLDQLDAAKAWLGEPAAGGD